MKISTSNIKHHPRNQEIYELSGIQDLKDSIEQVGLLQPLVINSHNEVISGNRRLLAIQQLDWEEVEVEQVKTDPDDELLRLIHYNKHRVKTCREILNESQILIDYYAKGQGFRSDLTSVQVNKGSSRDQIAEELGMPSSTIGTLLFIEKNDPSFIELIDSGDLTINQAYTQVRRVKNEKDTIFSIPSPNKTQSDQFRFYQHSSDQMPELDDQSVDLIFTSPPYWNKRTYTTEKELGSESTPKEFVDNLVDHFTDCKRVLKDTGSMFIVIGDTFHDECLQSIPHRFAIGLVEKGWILRNTIIWSKTNPKPQSSKNNLTPTYEFIFHLVKTKDYKYQHTLAPQKDSRVDARVPRHRGLDKKKVYPYIPRDGKNLGDFWTEDVVRASVAKNSRKDDTLEHPAPFPTDIIRLPIMQTTDQDDLILDLFMGSGTTGRVANEMCRQFVGYDIKSY
ncbi:DNA methyltransferase [Litoricolaceae bacterium]|nr:DNA methyltransferase [Litorivicinaceae bacterium]